MGGRPSKLWPGLSWGRRLVWTQFAVLVTMSVTLVLTALEMGPPLFKKHMAEAGHTQPMVLDHAERAFHDAGAVSLGLGLAAAMMIAAVTSWVLNRSLIRGLDALAEGAERVAHGNYDDPVRMPPLGRELESVAHEFNRMAAQIAATEATRRRMLTDLGHELRTPLSVTRVTLESLQDGVAVYGPEVLEVLQRQNERITALAADISEVSRAEEGRIPLELRLTRIDDLVESAVTSCAKACAEAGIQLVTRGNCPVEVDVDPARIGQVLDNLLRNAVQHTPRGGEVCVTSWSDKDSVSIQVTDTGAGIPAGEVSHVFERFFHQGSRRVRDVDGGTGVGLTIARAVARAHGGDVLAASPGVGCGASFTLVLPRSLDRISTLP